MIYIVISPSPTVILIQVGIKCYNKHWPFFTFSCSSVVLKFAVLQVNSLWFCKLAKQMIADFEEIFLAMHCDWVCDVCVLSTRIKRSNCLQNVVLKYNCLQAGRHSLSSCHLNFMLLFIFYLVEKGTAIFVCTAS